MTRFLFGEKVNIQEETPLWQWFSLIVATTGRSDVLAYKARCFLSWVVGSKKQVKPGSWAGTAGSLIALLVLFIFNWTFESICLAAVLSFFVGIFVITPAALWFSQNIGACNRHDGTSTTFDYNQINWDEVHGLFVSVLPVYFVHQFYPELGSSDFLWLDLLIAFVFFRLFDSRKWLGIKRVERWLGESPLGVMCDDTLAGIYAGLCTLIVMAI